MKVFKSIDGWLTWRNSLAPDSEIGFVPTMGALHRGHRSLLERARAEGPVAVASIFINPTQFNDPLDCQTYPVSTEEDLSMAQEVGLDAVLMPEFEALYPDDYRYRVTESCLSRELEGAHRPGHFDGMLTVVLKLLQLVRPTRAYFGEKDWQQLQLVKGLVEAFFLPIQVVACPTERAPDGLALSSRNRRLGAAARAQAPAVHEALVEAASAGEARSRLLEKGFRVEYVEDQGERRLAAVELDGVRLIDNVPLSPDRPSAHVSNGGNL